MCGLAGISEGAPGNATRLQTMIDSCRDARLAHRGLDDVGSWIDTRAWLGAWPPAAFNHRFISGRASADAFSKGGGRGRSGIEVMLAGIARWEASSTWHRSNGVFAAALGDYQSRELSLW